MNRNKRKRRLKKPVKYALFTMWFLSLFALITLSVCTYIKSSLNKEPEPQITSASTEVQTNSDNSNEAVEQASPEVIEFLNLKFSINEDNSATVSVEGTTKDTLEIQYLDNHTGEWEIINTYNYPYDGDLQTDILPSEITTEVRAVSYNQDNPGDISQSESISIRTNRTTVNSIIWPIKDLELLDSPQTKVKTTTIPGGTALRVEALEDGYFQTTYNGSNGYVNASYCMINLPDYLGDLCDYDITNSYSSIFKVHYAIIPEVTSTIIPGYEKVYLGNDEYLVPFLYPCTDKLLTAVDVAKASGYKLKIYEAFRPHVATRFLYDTVNEILYDKVADAIDTSGITEINPETGVAYTAEELASQKEEERRMEESVLIQKKQEAYNKYYKEAGELLTEQGVTDLSSDDAINVMNEYAQKKTDKEFPSDSATKKDTTGTYYSEMTDGSYALGAFLAKEVSAHNRGIALDLTLENILSEDEIPMQSSMHDLSYNSVVEKNNENANTLERIMKAAGFTGLSSEWWHFQDDTTRNSLNLNEYLELGISTP